MHFKLPHHLFGPQGNDHLQLHCFYFRCHFQFTCQWNLNPAPPRHLIPTTNLTNHPNHQVLVISSFCTSDFRPCSLLLQSDSYPYRQKVKLGANLGYTLKASWNRLIEDYPQKHTDSYQIHTSYIRKYTYTILHVRICEYASCSFFLVAEVSEGL